MNSRWKRARLNGYTEADKASIITTFLARAKSILPTIKNKIVKSALGIQSSASKEREDRIVKVTPVRKENNGGPSSSSNGKAKLDYRKMSDLEILNS